MSVELISDQVIQILRTKYGYTPEELTPTTDFAELDLDSLVFVELAVALENHCQVPLADEELAATGSIQQMVELIAAKATAGAVHAAKSTAVSV